MPTYERRIGRRVEVEPEVVWWRMPDERARRRWRKGPSVETGALVDISVSGLKVRAPAAHDLAVGKGVPVEIDGIVGTVIIRRIVPVPGTRFADYGVQISPTSYGLSAWATARLSEGSEIDEAAWQRRLDHSTS